VYKNQDTLHQHNARESDAQIIVVKPWKLSWTKSKKFWDALLKLFEWKTLANKLYQKKRHFRCVMSEGTPVQKHLMYMRETNWLASYYWKACWWWWSNGHIWLKLKNVLNHPFHFHTMKWRDKSLIWWQKRGNFFVDGIRDAKTAKKIVHDWLADLDEAVAISIADQQTNWTLRLIGAPRTDEAMEVDLLESGAKASISELTQLIKEMLTFQKSAQTYYPQGWARNLKWTKDWTSICCVCNKICHFSGDCYFKDKQHISKIRIHRYPAL